MADTANTGSNNWNTNGAWADASQPTAADDVTIPSGATVTVPAGTTVACRSITVESGGTLIFAATSSIINCGDGTAGAGNAAINISSGATITLTGIGQINLISTNSTTQTITTGGKTMPTVTINGAGSNYQFSDAYTSTGNLNYTAGASIDFNSFNHSVSAFTLSGNANIRQVIFGTSIVTCTLFGSTPFNAAGASNVTITATVGAEIRASSANNTNINLGSLDYGNVAFSHTTTSAQFSIITSSGATIYSYSRTGPASKTDSIRLDGTGLTTSNGFTYNGNSTANRAFIFAATIGTPFTLTNNGSYTFSNIDFQDITFAGSASTDFSAITGLSGDCGGNSGATFTTPTTQQYDGTAGNWSNAARWTSRIPLPQDDVTMASSSAAIALDMARVGKNVDFTNYTGTLTWTTTLGQTFYGSLTLSSGMSNSFGNTVNWVLAGRGNFTFDSAGKTFTGTNMSTIINAVGGTYTLASAYTTGHSISLLSGEFNTGNYTVTSSTFTTSGAVARTLTCGSSTWNLTGASGTVWSYTGSNLTFNRGTGSFVISTASASTRTIATNGAVFNTFSYVVAGSTGQLTIQGSPNFNTFNFADSSNARTLTLTAGITLRAKVFNASGASGRVITINTTSAGSVAYVELIEAVNTNDWMNIRDVFATIPGKFYAGANSTNTSNNTNVIFTAPVAGPTIHRQAEASASSNALAATFPNGETAAADNGLVAVYTSTSNPGSVTTPSGYDLIDSTILGTSVYMYSFKKVAVGGESSVTINTSNTVTGSVKLLELGDFTGTPTLDVTDENSGSAITSLATNGSNPSNTDNPALALAFFGGSNTLGASVSFSNSFGEQRNVTNLNYMRAAAKLLTSNAAVNTTYTWTTNRSAVSQLLVFKNSSSNDYTETPSDTATLSDSATKSVTISTADSATLSDVANKVISKPAADSVTISDDALRTLSQPLVDTVTLSEQTAKAVAKLAADELTTSDLISALSEYYRTFTDSITLSDDADAAFPESLDQTFADSISLSDSVQILINGKPRWFVRQSSQFANANSDTWYARDSNNWSN